MLASPNVSFNIIKTALILIYQFSFINVENNVGLFIRPVWIIIFDNKYFNKLSFFWFEYHDKRPLFTFKYVPLCIDILRGSRSL